MPATSYGLLAMLSGLLWAMLLVAPRDKVDAKSILAGSTASLYEIPNHIDEDDLLHEYGKFMLANMNQSVNPCEDFYEYACGNWQNDEMVPAKSRNDTFLHAMQGRIDALMNEFLSNTTGLNKLKEEEQLTAEEKVKKFYRSCIKPGNRDLAKGYKIIMEQFTEQLSNTSATNATYDWMNINFMSKYGVYPLLPLKVHYSTERRKFEVLLSVPTKAFGTIDVDVIKNLTRDFGLESEAEQQDFKVQLEQMIAFETNLTEHAKKRNETKVTTLGDFFALHKQDQLNWTRFFEVAFNGTAKKDWVVQNQFLDFDALAKLLQKTDHKLLQNYVKWRTLFKFYFIWKAEVLDKSVEGTCRKHTEQYFNYAIIPWFIENAYDVDRRADILTLAKSIKSSFYNIIDGYSWLDADTKSHAKTKLSSMDVLVGYSDDMSHRSSIDKVYSDLQMTDDWFENIFIIEANRARIRLRTVGRSIIPPLMSTHQVNAYYADFLNLAFIAIGLAQLPFYHINFPASLKFGGIGNIIGHEMAHGFDTYCYQFNFDGKRQNWWSEASMRNFRERYRCLESQYNKYIYHGVQTNGNLTSGDNIADNVGTRLAYFAYLETAGKKDGNQKPIPGMKFNNKQLYFIKFAQNWCNGRDVDTKLRRMKSDVHAYEEFRVLGTLSNMPEFSEVFQCKLGSEMNPLKKCVVW